MEAKALPNDINLCHTLIEELFESLGKFEKKVGRLEHTLEQLLRNRFGRKSERLEDMDPALLLPVMQDYLKELEEQKTQEREENSSPEEEEETKETLTYSRKKPKRKPLPKDLPRDRIEYDLDESEKICDCLANPCKESVPRPASNSITFLLPCGSSSMSVLNMPAKGVRKRW